VLYRVRKTADTAAPFLLIGALITLVILGAGAFKNPGYQGDASGSPGPVAAVSETPTKKQPVKATPSATPKPKPEATPKPKKKDKPKKAKPTRKHKQHKQGSKTPAVNTAPPAATAAPVTPQQTAVAQAPAPTSAPPTAPVATSAPPQPAATSAPPKQPSAPPQTIDDSG
jgi:hypothetical protein